MNAEQYQIDQATSRRDAARSQLYRGDGSPVFGEREHKERERAIEREYEAALDKIDAEVAAKAAEAQEALLVAETPDASTTLSTGEIERAAALRQFLAEETRGMSNTALAHRSRAAIAAGDRPTMFLLHHLATQRSNENPDSDLGFELRDVAHQLRTSLDPEAEARLEVAKQAVQEAEDLHFKVQMARAGASNIGDVFFGGGQGPSSYWGAARARGIGG
jgi:hypothetical protein